MSRRRRQHDAVTGTGPFEGVTSIRILVSQLHILNETGRGLRWLRRVTTFGKLYIKPGLVCDGLWSLPDRAEGSLYAQGCGPGRAEDTLYVHGARLDRAEGPLDALGSKPFVSNFGFNKTLNLYIYWVHKTGITYPTLQMTKTCLK